MKRSVYLDHAAATPVDPRVLQTMQPFWAAQFYNPSALYIPARKVYDAYQSARSNVARNLGAKAGEIIFTAGATESINLAIQGIAKNYPKGNIVITAVEHEAVAAAARAAFGSRLKICPVKQTGQVDLDSLAKLIDNQTVMVSVMYANNEVGSIQPVQKIAKLLDAIKARRKTGLPLYLHSDASQAANYLDLHVNRLGLDLLTLNGAKMYGPKQSGILYVKSGTELKPLIYGGGQERGLRSGTENAATAVGFAKALELAQASRQAETKRLLKLQTRLLAGITAIEGVKLNGDRRNRLPNNVNVSIAGVKGETLVHYLDQSGIMAATGAACSANKETHSATLLAVGLSREEADSSLRLTMGRQTKATDINYAIAQIRFAIRTLRR